MTRNTPIRPSSPGSLSIGTLSQARAHHKTFEAVISLEDPVAHAADRLRIRSPTIRRLVILCEDIDQDDTGLWAPSVADAANIVAFGRACTGTSLLIHCKAGVGRSTAAAFAILADRLGAGREAEALGEVLAMRPTACPNRQIVLHADTVLRRGSALANALRTWEATCPLVQKTRLGRARTLTLHRDLYSLRQHDS